MGILFITYITQLYCRNSESYCFCSVVGESLNTLTAFRIKKASNNFSITDIFPD